MLAATTTKYGPPDVLELAQIERPTPKPQDIIVRVHASSVTAADIMMRRGAPLFGRLFIGLFKPKNIVSGTGFSGTIEEIGSQVDTVKVGDRVFGETIFGFGSNAEYTSVPQNGLVMKLPENLPFDAVASVCDGLLTSMNFLKRLASIQSGQRVLINGASGSLGTAAVQIAHHFGAHVTAVCSKANHALVRSLGADQVIDYHEVDFTKTNQTWAVIFDTVGKSSFDETRAVLCENGKYLSPILGGTLCSMIRTSIYGKKKALFSATGLLPEPVLKALLSDVMELIVSGELKVIIDRRYELNQIVEAHRYVESGHKKGNVILMSSSTQGSNS